MGVWTWNAIIEKNMATIICSPCWRGAKHSRQLEKTNQPLRSFQIALENTIGIVAIYFSVKFSEDQVSVPSFGNLSIPVKIFWTLLDREISTLLIMVLFLYSLAGKLVHNCFPLFHNRSRARILWRQITVSKEPGLLRKCFLIADDCMYLFENGNIQKWCAGLAGLP